MAGHKLATLMRTLEAHQQRRLELGAGARGFFLCRLRGHGFDLGGHQRRHLAALVFGRPRIDTNHAGVAIGVRECIDRVAETAIFAQLLEQA